MRPHYGDHTNAEEKKKSMSRFAQPWITRCFMWIWRRSWVGNLTETWQPWLMIVLFVLFNIFHKMYKLLDCMLDDYMFLTLSSWFNVVWGHVIINIVCFHQNLLPWATASLIKPTCPPLNTRNKNLITWTPNLFTKGKQTTDLSIPDFVDQS